MPACGTSACYSAAFFSACCSQWYKKTKKKKVKFTLGPSLIYSSFQTHWLVTAFRVSCVRRSERPEDSFTRRPRRKTKSPPPPHPSGLVTPGHSCSSLMAPPTPCNYQHVYRIPLIIQPRISMEWAPSPIWGSSYRTHQIQMGAA